MIKNNKAKEDTKPAPESANKGSSSSPAKGGGDYEDELKRIQQEHDRKVEALQKMYAE